MRGAQLDELATVEVRSRDCPEARYTPSGLHAALLRAGHRLLLTSVRRSLTNLTRSGVLVHRKDVRLDGPFGAKETCWELAR